MEKLKLETTQEVFGEDTNFYKKKRSIKPVEGASKKYKCELSHVRIG